jgi:hypothetical protein
MGTVQMPDGAASACQLRSRVRGNHQFVSPCCSGARARLPTGLCSSSEQPFREQRRKTDEAARRRAELERPPDSRRDTRWLRARSDSGSNNKRTHAIPRLRPNQSAPARGFPLSRRTKSSDCSSEEKRPASPASRPRDTRRMRDGEPHRPLCVREPRGTIGELPVSRRESAAETDRRLFRPATTGACYDDSSRSGSVRRILGESTRGGTRSRKSTR